MEGLYMEGPLALTECPHQCQLGLCQLCQLAQSLAQELCQSLAQELGLQ